jgi:hypothetical protein
MSSSAASAAAVVEPYRSVPGPDRFLKRRDGSEVSGVFFLCFGVWSVCGGTELCLPFPDPVFSLMHNVGSCAFSRFVTCVIVMVVVLVSSDVLATQRVTSLVNERGEPVHR